MREEEDGGGGRGEGGGGEGGKGEGRRWIEEGGVVNQVGRQHSLWVWAHLSGLVLCRDGGVVVCQSPYECHRPPGLRGGERVPHTP